MSVARAGLYLLALLACVAGRADGLSSAGIPTELDFRPASPPSAPGQPARSPRAAPSVCPPVSPTGPKLGLPPVGLDPYYAKAVDGTIPIYASKRVCDRYLQIASDAVIKMFSARPELREKLGRRGVAVVIFAEGERTSDVPFFDRNPTKKNIGAAGLGSSIGPVTVHELDFIGVQSADSWSTSVLFHELGHSVDFFVLESGEHRVVEDAYRDAKAKGWQKDTYAMTSSYEFFAEAVSAWLTRGKPSRPTREEYRKAYPQVTAILEDLF